MIYNYNCNHYSLTQDRLGNLEAKCNVWVNCKECIHYEERTEPNIALDLIKYLSEKRFNETCTNK
jgi:hypothetical protein